MAKKRNKKSKISAKQGVAIFILLMIIPVAIAIAFYQEIQEINIPEGCGTFATREWDLNYYECDETTPQYKVDKLWHKKGKQDKLGFQKLYGRYLIACTNTFGKVGDKIDFYMSNGQVIPCIIYDLKSRSKEFYDKHPASRWGHQKGKVVLEFVGTADLHSNPYIDLGVDGERTVKAVKKGNIFKK